MKDPSIKEENPRGNVDFLKETIDFVDSILSKGLTIVNMSDITIAKRAENWSPKTHLMYFLAVVTNLLFKAGNFVLILAFLYGVLWITKS